MAPNESDVMDASLPKVLPMRRTLSLSLPVIAAFILLANCAAPADDATDEALATSATTEASDALDTREGLAALPTVAPARRGRTLDFGAEAIAYVTSAAESAGAKNVDFKVTNVAKDTDGLTHVRLQQIHDGNVVWGADQVVHFNDTTILGAAGSIANAISITQAAATLSGADALALAKKDRYGAQKVVTSREATTPVVFVDAQGVSHAAVQTEFFNELQGDIAPAFWHHIYDAQDGKLLARWNGVHTLEQASGPGGNPKFQHSWESALDVETRGEGFVMTTTKLKTLNMKNTSGSGSEVTGALDSFQDSVINDGHGYAEVVLNFLQEWHNRNSIDERGFVIVSRVHYGNRYENAFWDGRQMTYGDGATTFYPLTGGIDVISHEINHGFTNFHSKLAYSGEPGAFNEGFSDIAGKAAEFYFKGADFSNFDIGRDVYRAPDKALRYMCDPKKDGRSIDNASQMRPSTDPHYSSGVPNKAFCRFAKRLSTNGDPEGVATVEGVKRASQVFYLANASYWTSSTKFVQGCKGTVDASTALEGGSADEIAYLRASWADVGVTCK